MGTNTYPVTYQVLELAGGSFALFMLIMITFYSGELVWRERDIGVHEIVDALPVPHRTLFLSKLFALFMVQVLLEVVVMLAGIGIQLAKGLYAHRARQYIRTLFGIQLSITG